MIDSEHQQMYDLMDRLDNMQYGGQWEQLDDLFDQVDVETINILLLITYLRCTYVAAKKEHRFSRWDDLLSRAKAKYDSKDLRTFRGLDQPYREWT